MTGVQRARSVPPETGAVQVSGLFRARYPEMVRLADLLGADDPEDIAQEAFARLIRKTGSLRDPAAALAYVRSTVCNLVRNRHRHLRVARQRTPSRPDEASSEHGHDPRGPPRAPGGARSPPGSAAGGHRAAVLARSARAGDRRGHGRVDGNRQVTREPWPGRAWRGAGGKAMTALEDRLREALAERAAHSRIDPHAWDKAV